MSVITVTIRRRVPSQNSSTFGSRFAYVKERDAWYALLRAGLRPRLQPTQRVRVCIVSYRNRLLDRANLWGGTKAIWDGLVRLGHLRDDSPRWLDDHVEQVKCKRVDERTTITIHHPEQDAP